MRGGGKFANGAYTSAFQAIVSGSPGGESANQRESGNHSKLRIVAEWLLDDIYNGVKGWFFDKPEALSRQLIEIWSSRDGLALKLVKSAGRIVQQVLIPVKRPWLGSGICSDELEPAQRDFFRQHEHEQFLSSTNSKDQNASIVHDFENDPHFCPLDPWRHTRWEKIFGVVLGWSLVPLGRYTGPLEQLHFLSSLLRKLLEALSLDKL